ncbi:MAG: hypothetical protein JW924_11260 [Fusobacteriaceae bacterium]|nr:hypothetical protein [Fusobacteriaceae bacterium]
MKNRSTVIGFLIFLVISPYTYLEKEYFIGIHKLLSDFLYYMGSNRSSIEIFFIETLTLSVIILLIFEERIIKFLREKREIFIKISKVVIAIGIIITIFSTAFFLKIINTQDPNIAINNDIDIIRLKGELLQDQIIIIGKEQGKLEKISSIRTGGRTLEYYIPLVINGEESIKYLIKTSKPQELTVYLKGAKKKIDLSTNTTIELDTYINKNNLSKSLRDRLEKEGYKLSDEVSVIDPLRKLSSKGIGLIYDYIPFLIVIGIYLIFLGILSYKMMKKLKKIYSKI